MAKINAKSRGDGGMQVTIEGRLDDVAVLAVNVIMALGSKIRETLIEQGVDRIEPEGEEPNDFALAMVHMNRAVRSRIDGSTPTPPANDTKH